MATNHHTPKAAKLSHSHHAVEIHSDNERRTAIVVAITLITMIAEIATGFLSGSMALLSDGWHMGTHAGALGIAVFAYSYSRRHRNDSRYTFGTGKVGVLAAFASAIILGVTGLLIFYESIMRLLNPVNIEFNSAIFVAVIGLMVNLVCALILGGGAHEHHHNHHHEHQHDHEHDHPHPHEDTRNLGGEAVDHNMRAAFLHVLADALTSVLAIAALIVGKCFGMIWLDALAGLLGGVMIISWSYGLIRRTTRILLDGDVEPEIIDEIRKTIENDDNRNEVIDLHVWRIGENELAAIVSLVSDNPQQPEYYHAMLKKYRDLIHISVEVTRCDCEIP